MAEEVTEMILVLRGEDTVKHYPYTTPEELNEACMQIVQHRYTNGIYPGKAPKPIRPNIPEAKIQKFKHSRLRDLGLREWTQYRKEHKKAAAWSENNKQLRKALRDNTGEESWKFLQAHQSDPLLGFDLVPSE